MEKVLWKAYILPGMEEEYVKRHDNIWPEMLENLKAQGISNYSIFKCGTEIIGYYECESIEEMKRVKASNPIAAKWSESMKNVIRMDLDAGGKTRDFIQVFYMD